MVDEVAIPDRFEQAIGKTARENILRRLFAEKMIDAKNLRFGEHFMQLRIQRHRTVFVGAERLFHDHPRLRHEAGFAEHTHC